MKVLILTNGAYGDYTFCKEDLAKEGPYDFVICADRGMSHALKLEIKPDLIVGDFDSGNEADLAYYRLLQIPVEVFNPHKDETDTEIAIKRAITQGATSVTIYGGVGTRLDHSLGNVHLLYSLLKLGIKARLMNPYNVVQLMNDHIILKGKVEDIVSLIPFAGSVSGITTRNLGYPLCKGTLEIGGSLGVSNYMTAEQAEIWVEEGILIVIQARD